MGCTSSQAQQPHLLRLPTPTGILRTTIINARIQHQTSTFFAMDPYIKLKVSNQSATTNVVKKGGKEPVFNEVFEFFINSCYQVEGRHLEVEVWDCNKTGDSLIGVGMVDLDPVLLEGGNNSSGSNNTNNDKKDNSNNNNNNSNKISKPLRVFLNYDIKPAGVVNLSLQFKPQPFEYLNFRFQTVSIRRKTSSMGNMNCFVKVTIGQEVLKTRKKKDTVEMPPVWVDETLMVNTPRVVKNCIVEVWDQGSLVGECVLKVEDLLKETKEKQYDQDIFYNDAIAGTLRFQTMIGERVQFSEIKRDYKRKKQQPKVEGDKKKQGDKKEGDKKEEGDKGKEENNKKEGQNKKEEGKQKEKEKPKQTGKPQASTGRKQEENKA